MQAVQIDMGQLPELGTMRANHGTSLNADSAISATSDIWVVAVIYLYESDDRNGG